MSSFKESETFSPSNKWEQYLYNWIITAKQDLNNEEIQAKENQQIKNEEEHEQGIQEIWNIFEQDLFKIESEYKVEESILNKKCKQNLKSGKPIFLNDSSIIFEGDLDKNIKFVHDRI